MITDYLCDTLASLQFLCFMMSVLFGSCVFIHTITTFVSDNTYNQSQIKPLPKWIYFLLVLSILGGVFIPSQLKYNYLAQERQKNTELQQQIIDLKTQLQEYQIKYQLEQQ